jgi:hypothetical protein
VGILLVEGVRMAAIDDKWVVVVVACRGSGVAVRGRGGESWMVGGEKFHGGEGGTLTKRQAGWRGKRQVAQLS